MQQPSSAITSYEVGSLGTEEAEEDKKLIASSGDESMQDQMTESSGETMICDGCRLCVCVCWCLFLGVS